ncbi:hypothetical protein WJX74_003279 [Apatococcus lobatus]|uniref:DUF4485 domain-containing protein n=1 Tax=Apatococcus lobatus TaxID=904363 RepID=A0AAW1QHV8_9CHLO
MVANLTLAQNTCRLERESFQTKRSLSPNKSKTNAEGFKELQPLFSLLGVNTKVQQKMGESGMVGSLCTSASAWRDAFEEIRASHSLDSSFAKIAMEANQRRDLLNRQSAHRIKQWLDKLSEPTGNMIWKRNRNLYGLLLLLQLRAGRLEAPFDRSPMPEPLPAMPKWRIKAFASGRSTQRCTSMPTHSRAEGAAGRLHAYAGRTGSEELLPSGVFQPCSAHSGASSSESPRLLPGTGMQLVGAAAQRAESGSPSRRAALREPAAWQPSLLQVEAQLGASRERASQLAWQLAEAQERAQAQADKQMAAGLRQGRLRSPAKGSHGSSSVQPSKQRGCVEGQLSSLQAKTAALRFQMDQEDAERGSPGGFIPAFMPELPYQQSQIRRPLGPPPTFHHPLPQSSSAEPEHNDRPLPLCDAAFSRLGSSEAQVGSDKARDACGLATQASLPVHSSAGLLDTMPQLRPLRLSHSSMAGASHAPASARAILQASRNDQGSEPVTPTWRTHQAEVVVITPNKSRRFPGADANPLEVAIAEGPQGLARLTSGPASNAINPIKLVSHRHEAPAEHSAQKHSGFAGKLQKFDQQTSRLKRAIEAIGRQAP